MALPPLPRLTRPRALIAIGVGAAALAGALIAVSLVSSSGGGGSPTTTAPTRRVAGAAETEALLRGIPQDGIALGRPSAPVTIVEFADIQCPFCAQWAVDAFPDLVREYVRPGHVRIVFRGLAFIGPESDAALRTVLAAGRQGKLWNVLELLFGNQGTENSGWVTDDLLQAVGKSVPGLNVESLLVDLESPAVNGGIAEAAREAEAAGIRGTPSFLVGRTGGQLAPLRPTSLAASAFRPALDALPRR